jgi:hypothetical protein
MVSRARSARRALVFAPLAALLITVAGFPGGVSGAWAGVWVKPDGKRAAAAYWTPARMREAKPVEVKHPWSRVERSTQRRARGAAHRIAPIAPRAADFGSDFELVPDPTGEGFRVHGAIFISLGIFGYGRCSGTAVRSGNESVVLTAGHCVNSGGPDGRWLTSRWAFVPAYRYGQRPFGVFPARWIDTTTQWRASGSENYDVGAAVVGPNERGETLGQAVGGAGIAWNLKARQTFDVHGYPAEEPFDGQTQRLCTHQRFLGHDPESFFYPGPLNLAVPCEVTGGASGGGWTIRGDTLNSVTDYGYFGESSPDYGAYFGREVAHLYHRAAAIR